MAPACGGLTLGYFVEPLTGLLGLAGLLGLDERFEDEELTRLDALALTRTGANGGISRAARDTTLPARTSGQ